MSAPNPPLTPKRVPRPMNGFMIFSKEKYDGMKAMNANGEQRLSSRDIAKMWWDSDQDVRDSYMDKARQVEAEHMARYPNYKYEPQPRAKGAGKRRAKVNPQSSKVKGKEDITSIPVKKARMDPPTCQRPATEPEAVAEVGDSHASSTDANIGTRTYPSTECHVTPGPAADTMVGDNDQMIDQGLQVEGPDVVESFKARVLPQPSNMNFILFRVPNYQRDERRSEEIPVLPPPKKHGTRIYFDDVPQHGISANKTNLSTRKLTSRSVRKQKIVGIYKQSNKNVRCGMKENECTIVKPSFSRGEVSAHDINVLPEPSTTSNSYRSCGQDTSDMEIDQSHSAYPHKQATTPHISNTYDQNGIGSCHSDQGDPCINCGQPTPRVTLPSFNDFIASLEG